MSVQLPLFGPASDNDAMGNLGARLKREREARKIALEEVARRTRISIHSLQAIEEAKFEQLPGGIFNKSFIKQYAECLGLDGEQAAREYARMVSVESAEKEAAANTAPPPPALSRETVWMLRAGLGAAALGIILVVAWLLLPSSKQAAQRASQQAVDMQGSPAAAAVKIPEPAAGVRPSTAAPASAGAARTDRVSDAGPATAHVAEAARQPLEAASLLADDTNQVHLPGELPEELLLQIDARGTVWLSITADGEKQWQGTMEANQQRQVQANETIRLTVGNAGGVELTLNGKSLGSLGSEGEVKTVTLASRALQEAVP